MSRTGRALARAERACNENAAGSSINITCPIFNPSRMGNHQQRSRPLESASHALDPLRRQPWMHGLSRDALRYRMEKYALK
jgi:hypothetical protein